MTRRPHHSFVALAVALASAIAFGASPAATALAAAQTAPAAGDSVTITEVDSSRFPMVRLAFGADDLDGETPGFTFFEGNDELANVSLYNGELGNYEDRRRADVMLVLDTSQSMGQSSRIDDAVAAADRLVDHARKGDRIGLVTFGGTARVIVEPTADHDQVGRALARVELQNRTTMFDGVSMAARAFEGNANRSIVLLSDGTDVGSVESLDEAAGEAIKAGAPIYSVAIREDAKEQPHDLAALGNGTGGELRTIVGTSQLDSLFDELGRRILQPYWVEYRSNAPLRSQLRFGVAVEGSSKVAASIAFRAIPSSETASQGNALKKSVLDEPIIPIPGGLLGAFLASLPFAILVFSFAYVQLQRKTKPNIIARIDRYTTQATAQNIDGRNKKQKASLLTRVASPFNAMSESFLGRSKFFERVRVRAEQANIAIKPSELFTAMIAMGAFGVLLSMLFGRPMLYVILVPSMFYFPSFWLRRKARKRRRAFEDQLPDVLQGIASSLNAGHSFNQAINAMIKDVPNPTAEEFSRVMTEARLGMPLEQALQNMADRMASDDFDFAVTTVNIQRTVGGSLAVILEMVGDTVRNRQQFRKKVKALTSMGQMSAYVLLGMPFFIGAVLTLINPDYMAPMFSTSTGHMMLAAGAVSMTLGYFACMKVVSVKV